LGFSHGIKNCQSSSPHPYGDLDTLKKIIYIPEEERGMVCESENLENWGCQMRPFRVGQCGSGKSLSGPLA